MKNIKLKTTIEKFSELFGMFIIAYVLFASVIGTAYMFETGLNKEEQFTNNQQKCFAKGGDIYYQKINSKGTLFYEGCEVESKKIEL